MATDLLIGIAGIIIGVALVLVIRGKDGNPRFLRTSGWLIVYPVLPLLSLTIGGAWLIRALS
ncbi:hypothetical protein JKG68_18155 [Microvirga aerilata]|jgi:hypothetical protein|uniref:Uncharacterized protein n=1 Tax=Microvirga aerilata TaxID=670292 RepID=A0A937D315_9HYPH|nr:hypothetical protein [Microvirga aerilata]MBL0405885.1 hypothetical protein [Microvirga aerilata]